MKKNLNVICRRKYKLPVYDPHFSPLLFQQFCRSIPNPYISRACSWCCRGEGQCRRNDLTFRRSVSSLGDIARERSWEPEWNATGWKRNVHKDRSSCTKLWAVRQHNICCYMAILYINLTSFTVLLLQVLRIRTCVCVVHIEGANEMALLYLRKWTNRGANRRGRHVIT